MLGWPAAETLCVHPEATAGEAPLATSLPADPDLVVGTLSALSSIDVDAVVSLCRVGHNEVGDGVEHHRVHLVDQAGAQANVRFILAQAVEAIRTFRGEGKRVFVHCVGGHSRTPTVVAGYLMRQLGFSHDDAIAEVNSVLDYGDWNDDFSGWLAVLEEGGPSC